MRLGVFLFRRISAVGRDSRFDKHRDVMVNMFLMFSLSVCFSSLRASWNTSAFAHEWMTGCCMCAGLVGIFVFTSGAGSERSSI